MFRIDWCQFETKVVNCDSCHASFKHLSELVYRVDTNDYFTVIGLILIDTNITSTLGTWRPIVFNVLRCMNND